MALWGIPWWAIYGAAAFTVVAFSLRSGRWSVQVGGALIAMSWLVAKIVIGLKLPDEGFLAYFAFDFASAEIMLFMLIYRFEIWKAVFLVALLIQMGLHLAFYIGALDRQAYVERINALYIVEMVAALVAATRRPPARPNSDAWLGPRITKEDVVAMARRSMGLKQNYHTC